MVALLQLKLINKTKIYIMKNSNDENFNATIGNTVLPAVLSEDDLLSIGFERIPHFTVNRAMIYQLGRNRHLSVGDVGTPNEMIFICESDKDDYRKITDLICLHNFDYDGYLSKHKLETLIKCLGVSQHGR